MRLAGAVLVFFAAAGLGAYQGRKIRKKYEELLYLKRIILTLRGEINYQVSTMSEIFLHLSERLKSPYAEAFSELGRRIDEGWGENFSDMWNEIIIENLRQVILCDRDLDRLRELGENLGFLDKDMQINYLNLFLENLNVSITDKRERVQTDEKLSRIMGILSGIFIIVFLW